MEIDRESLFTMDNDEMEVENQEEPQIKRRVPRRSPPVVPQMAHPELLETFLPHRGMLYQYNGPRRISLTPHSLLGEDCEGAFYRPSILSEVFPQGFDEIAEKKWLKMEVAGVIDEIVKKVHSLPPFSFLLRYAPLHSIRESWGKMAPGGSSNNQQRSAPVTPRSTIEGTIRTSAITKNSSVKIMMPDNRKENQRESFGQRQHNKAKDFLVSYNNEQLAALQSFLATDSPTKLEMALLATPVESVFRYVRGYLAVVLNRKKFFGSNHNERRFLFYLARYLDVGVTDRLPVGCLIGEMDMDAIPWLKRVSPFNRDLILGEFFMWIFGQIVNALVNRTFYVTPTQFRKNERMYFRREIWNMLRKTTVEEFVQRGFWRPLSTVSEEGRPSELEDFLSVSKDMQATYRTRFVPRDFGIRPIMIPRSITGHDMRPWERRQRLQNSRLILSYVLQRYPEMRGFGMENAAEIQKRWTNFRQYRLRSKDSRPLFFVTCDIQKAYDSIDIPGLRKIIQRRYQKLQVDGLKFFFIYDLLQVARKQGRTSLPPGTYRYKVLSKDDYDQVVDKDELGQPTCVELQEVFADISYMSVPGVFQAIGRKWFTFLRGVPQGCSLSSYFLNFYYGQFEMELGNAVKADELLMRYMDDIVYLTPHPERASNFLRGVTVGVPQIQLCFNPTKTHTNLPDSRSTAGLGAQCSHKSMTSLCWYGWEFDLVGLHLKVDMRRYHPYRIRYCFSRNYADESILLKSVYATITGKFAAALFDLACCPKDIIVQNTHEMFLLCGMYLLAYWRGCQRVARRQKRVLWLLRILVKSLTHCLMERFESRSAMVLSDAQVQVLAWQALVTVLCLEGKRFSPLRRGCRQTIIDTAMRHLSELEQNEENDWIAAFMSDRNCRYPIAFRNLS